MSRDALLGIAILCIGLIAESPPARPAGPAGPPDSDAPAERDRSAGGAGAEAEIDRLVIPIYPGPPWKLATTPLADDPLQDEPAQATVYDATILRDARIEDTQDLAAVAPGIQMSGQTNRLTLRGTGSLLLFTTAETPVGLYIDDVYVSNPAAFNFDLFDVDRVAVRRGPQGFDGGRTAIAGALRVETAAPRPGHSGALDLAVGRFAHRQVRAHVNTELPDGTAYNRLAASYRERDGTVRNLATGERIDTLDNWGLRDRVTLKPSPDLALGLSVDYADYSPVRVAAGPFGSVLDGDVAISRPTTENRRLYGGNLRIDRHGDTARLTSITALRGVEFDSLGSDVTAGDLLLNGLKQSQLTMSQELRVGSSDQDALDWVIGTFLYGQSTDQEALLQLENAAIPLGLTPGHAETAISDQQVWSAGLFGSATLRLTDHLDLFGGLRADYDRVELDYRYVSNDGIAVLAPLQTRMADADFTELSWRLGLSYEIARGVAPYASVTRVAKPGGFNTTLLPLTEIGFGNESATNYELGVKSTWFGGRAVANAAVFLLRREDQQVQNIGAFGSPTVNAEESRSRGIELTLAGRPVPGLDLYFDYAYIESEFVEFPDFPATGGGTRDLSGFETPFTSHHGLSLALHYVRPLSEDLRLALRTDYSYRSAFFFDAVNSLRQPGYGLWNARFGLEGDAWGAYLWGKNLTDTKYRTSAFTDPTAGSVAIAGDPRTLGVQFRLRF